MKIAIVIVSYNTSLLTVQTVKSVLADLKTSPGLAKQSELWLVDNNSTDDTIKQLHLQFATNLSSNAHPELKIIKNDHNVGFSAANNQAIRQSEAELILLLNSDTVVQPGCLANLVAAFDQPRNQQSANLSETAKVADNLGVISCALINQDGTPQPQGGSFPNLFSLASHWLMIDDVPVLGALLPSTQHTGWNTRALSESAKVVACDWVGGTAMGLRREMLDEIDLLDENIFMYAEDMELCLRAKNHHWDVGILPTAKVTHYGSASSSSKNAILGELKGYLYIWAKHKPVWQLGIVKNILRVGCLLRMQLFSVLGQPHKRAIYHQALTDVLR